MNTEFVTAEEYCLTMDSLAGAIADQSRNCIYTATLAQLIAHELGISEERFLQIQKVAREHAHAVQNDIAQQVDEEFSDEPA